MRAGVVCAAAAWILGMGSWSVVAGGCSSTSRKTGSIAVAYRFENVRKPANGLDEWEAIAEVLRRHGAISGTPRTTSRRKVGSSEVRDVSVVLILSEFASLDKVHAELDAGVNAGAGATWWDELTGSSSQKPGRGAGMGYDLADAALRYTSNFVVSEVNISLSGYTARGFTVELYLAGGERAWIGKADRRGWWKSSLKIPAGTRHVYGRSDDERNEQTRARYFRVNIETYRHEDISRDEFEAVVGKKTGDARGVKAGR